ncbi:MAG TPA: 16S rRNA (guanine(527)-N(7))-methyltransferase RsmG [candidate division Zixibacteria bacterium]|nr:16S rRNA (guanine(527)-N(7))-methyltransferase RsmG [candidate division Zixibacteria bacterium]
MSGTDAADAARAALEPLLADAPDVAGLLPPGALDRLERYVALLLEANARLNLTRVTAPHEVARWHLLDSLAALPLLSETDGAVADLGSGGGLPAIPLAIARPDLRWTLVESVEKKAAVLRGFAEALSLPHVAVVAERAEGLGRDPRHRERYAAVTARAVAALPVLAELALPLLIPGGRLLAWKGPLTEDSEEVRRGRVAIGQLGGGRLEVRAALPALGDHTFVAVPKVGPTPARFPRRPGEPSRRPLG